MAEAEARKLHNQLRMLAAADPRQARQVFSALMDANHPQLEELLRLLSAPGEGRIRQVVANAVRGRADKEPIVPWLLRWAKVEVDEFTKTAIAAALAGVDRQQRPDLLPDDPDKVLVGTYRYIAERLCHRVRNALMGPGTCLLELDLALENLVDQRVRMEIKGIVSRLRDGLRLVGRRVEFNINDDYFTWRSVALCDWLERMNAAYAGPHGPVRLTVTGALNRSQFRIRANDLLLEIIFGNLWTNAVQAVQGPCSITVNVKADQGQLELVFSDNGPGFAPIHVGEAFKSAFSTKGFDRGRGLLEVYEAVSRLQGTAQIVAVEPGEYRVCLSFPLEAP